MPLIVIKFNSDKIAVFLFYFFFFKDPPTPEISPLPLPDALPIYATVPRLPLEPVADLGAVVLASEAVDADRAEQPARFRIDDHERRVGALLPRASRTLDEIGDRKSTRLNSSHSQISYAVFCLTKK